ncbi:MAG: DUF4384 domain-containing protein [Rhodocyclaceae bacterium]|nr:DUF4384 domain-containing protein [Rhodocyclaceae bacterium]
MITDALLRPCRQALSLAIGLSLFGCAAIDVKTETLEKTEAIRIGPEAQPHRSITGFTDALRCMDITLSNYGVRDVSVLAEDVLDQTKKVNAGTSDMLITAVSEMTKRSRAIRLVAFGQDSRNLITFLQQAESKSAYSVKPQFDIKGSITQLDENLIQKQTDAGLGFDSGASFGIGAGIAKDAATNILALDLTMLDTEDFSVLPGVTSRNAVVIFKEGSGFDADATIRKFGVNYNMSLSRAEGQSQALRNLVELAAIELFGKLTRTPYWKCLGATGDEPEIRREIRDWYSGFVARPPQLTAWFQNQLRLRGYYRGFVDGVNSRELRDAAVGYRKALGLPEEGGLDLEFFTAYLAADHANVMARASTPFPMTLSANYGQTLFQPGERIDLVLQTGVDAYVQCYLQDENGQIQRFFPNRFQRDALVKANDPLYLPGSMLFEFVANRQGIQETVTCFAAENDLMQMLPGPIVGTDFENLPVSSLEQVRDAYRRAAGTDFVERTFNVETQ